MICTIPATALAAEHLLGPILATWPQGQVHASDRLSGPVFRGSVLQEVLLENVRVARFG